MRSRLRVLSLLLLVRLMRGVKRIKYEFVDLPAASVAARVPHWWRSEKMI
jgi:hypothetical protein